MEEWSAGGGAGSGGAGGEVGGGGLRLEDVDGGVCDAAQQLRSRPAWTRAGERAKIGGREGGSEGGRKRGS